MKKMTLDDALDKIKDLEKEVKKLKKENADLKGKIGGRRLHDDAWMAKYNAFIKKYEKRGKKPLAEVVDTCGISRRTAYRYLEFYKESK